MANFTRMASLINHKVIYWKQRSCKTNVVVVQETTMVNLPHNWSANYSNTTMADLIFWLWFDKGSSWQLMNMSPWNYYNIQFQLTSEIHISRMVVKYLVNLPLCRVGGLVNYENYLLWTLIIYYNSDKSSKKLFVPKTYAASW